MRDLTKSLMSFSWAMSMFGLKQALDLLNPQNMGQAASSFEEVTRATESQLGSLTRSTFQAGDRLQRGMVDMAFSMLGWGFWNPNEMMRMGTDAVQRTTQAGVDVMQQSAQAMGQMMPGSGGWDGGRQRGGWGSGTQDGWGGSSAQGGWGGSGSQGGWGDSGAQGDWGGSGAQGGWGDSGTQGGGGSSYGTQGSWGGSGTQGGWGGSGTQGGWGGSATQGSGRSQSSGTQQQSGWGPMPQQDCGCQRS